MLKSLNLCSGDTIQVAKLNIKAQNKKAMKKPFVKSLGMIVSICLIAVIFAPSAQAQTRRYARDRAEDVRDRREDRRDRAEDIRDRREDIRDRAEDRWDARHNGGLRDRLEDIRDRQEDIRDRREDVRDRREDIHDRAEDRWDRTHGVPPRLRPRTR